MPLISVIVPVYKVEPYLERCVESILAQTFSDYELILVDDGSPDRCPQMCDAYAGKDSRIHVIHQENGGLSAARNAGLDWIFENSDSSWVTFIDSDDWVHPLYLECLLDAAERFHCSVSMGQLLVTEDYRINDITEEEREPRLWDTEIAFEEEALDPNSACARLFLKTLFREIRFPVGKLHEDRFTTYKLLFQSEKTAVVSAPLYYYFVNNEGIVHSQWTLRKLDDLEATEQQLEYFRRNGWERTYICTLRDYIHLMVYSLRNMKGKKEFAEAAAGVRQKLRRVLRENSKMLEMTWDRDFNTYKYAYPIAAKVYRRIRSIKR